MKQMNNLLLLLTVLCFQAVAQADSVSYESTLTTVSGAKNARKHAFKLGICVGESLALQVQAGTVVLPPHGQTAATMDAAAKANLKQVYQAVVKACIALNKNS